jgi:endogenous inhibitor of DNA gyrase (YacG/DUF329 family)
MRSCTKPCYQPDLRASVYAVNLLYYSKALEVSLARGSEVQAQCILAVAEKAWNNGTLYVKPPQPFCSQICKTSSDLPCWLQERSPKQSRGTSAVTQLLTSDILHVMYCHSETLLV